MDEEKATTSRERRAGLNALFHGAELSSQRSAGAIDPTEKRCTALTLSDRWFARLDLCE
jgi:hypothetical protein